MLNIARFGFVALVVTFLTCLATTVVASSHFHSDDLWHILAQLDRSVLEYARLPIDVHVAPLHRLASLTMFKLAPWRFDVAIIVELIMHVGATVYLFATLQRVRRCELNWTVAVLYATNAFLVAPLLWWTAGLHRFPYALGCLGALYHWTHSRGRGFDVHFAAVVGWVAFAAGFYAKGFLIPFYIVGLEICLDRERGVRNVAYGLRVPLFLVAITCVAVAVSYPAERPIDAVAMTGLSRAEFFAAWRQFFLGVEIHSLVNYWAGLLGGLLIVTPSWIQLVICGSWVVLAGWAIGRDRSAFVPWLVLCLLIVGNVAVVTLSSRIQYGGYLAVQPRYYFELVFLAAVFVPLALPTRNVGAAISRDGNRQAHLAFAGLLLCCVCSGIAFWQSTRLIDSHFGELALRRQFVLNLRADLAALQARGGVPVGFANERLPKEVWTAFYPHVDPARFVRIFGYAPTPRETATRIYRISNDGRLVRVDG